MQGAVEVVAAVKHGIERSTQAAESAASHTFAELRKAVDLRERAILKVKTSEGQAYYGWCM